MTVARLTPTQVPRSRPWPLLELLSRLHAPTLDRLLADGVAPEASDVLARRAAHLRRHQTRRALGRGIADAVAAADSPTRAASAALALPPMTARRAGPRLRELASVLCDRPTCDGVRGAALAALLLLDGAGPLYRPGAAQLVEDLAEKAIDGLCDPR